MPLKDFSFSTTENHPDGDEATFDRYLILENDNGTLNNVNLNDDSEIYSELLAKGDIYLIPQDY